MCLNPISIVNPTKYISLRHCDQYLLQVPCGHCAECQSTLSQQWMYRSFIEFNDCLKSGGSNFIYFDTLTYDNKHVPHIKEYMDCESDFLCFRPKDVTDFFKRLRIQLVRDGYQDVGIRYFLSSEYGTNPKLKGQNRPHYHILLYVYGKINPIELSRYVSDCWSLGRTDGVPFRSANYVIGHNVIYECNTANILRTSLYVTKYVQKSCVFQAELNKRIVNVMNDYANKFEPDNPEKWLKTLAAARIRMRLNLLVNQFHRQSLHYGESALCDMDIDQIFRDGVLYMPDSKRVQIPVLLPMYYKRKLFYNLVEVNGAKSWQLNDLGIRYREVRKRRLQSDLESRLQCVCIQHHLDYDCKRLANYVVNQRGRIKGYLPESTLQERLQQLDLFNYVTLTDKSELMFRGLCPEWLGNVARGYIVDVMPPYITIKDFIGKYVDIQQDREKELAHICYLLETIDKGKQDAFELKQKLTNVFKVFR